MNDNPALPEQSGSASQSEQILNASNPDACPKEIGPQWKPSYERLLRLKDRLIDSQQDLEDKAREIQSDENIEEPAEGGTDTFQRDFALGMSSFQQEFLAEVLAAMDRIENGGYGICEVTGEAIPLERLEAVPWARTTVEGQRQLEETGQASVSGIGARGSLRVRAVEQPGPAREKERSL